MCRKVLIVTALLLFSAGCGGGASVVSDLADSAAIAQPDAAMLPGIPADLPEDEFYRETSAATPGIRRIDVTDPYSEHKTKVVEVAPGVEALELKAANGSPHGEPKLAYAMYKVTHIDRPDLNRELQYLVLETSSTDLDHEYWLGLANFDSRAWEWYGPGNTIPEYELDLTALEYDYTSVMGNMYFLVVVYQKNTILLRDANVLYLDDVDSNEPPVAMLSADPLTGDAPLPVAFDASASTDSDGTIEAYDWDFDGDGTWDITGSTSATADYTYTAAGTYNATVRVYDDDGATDEASVEVVVEELVGDPEICFAGKKNGQWGIYLTDAEGSSFEKVCDTGYTIGTAFSPDGTRIVFSSRESGTDKLYLVNIESSEKLLLTPQPGWYVEPSWQDNDYIVFHRFTIRENEIHRIKADGSEFQQLSHTNNITERSHWLSPSGANIVYGRNRPYTRSCRLFIVDFPSFDNPRRLVSIAGDTYRQESPCWSPDGNLIAFSAWPDGTTLTQIYTVGVDGSGLTCWSPAGVKEYYSRFSPECDRLVVQSYSGPSTRSICVVDITGAGGRTYISDGFDDASSPDWYVPR